MIFLLKDEVIKRVRYSDQHLLRMEKAGKFPRRVQIGPGRVGWPEDEITAWQLARMAARDAGPAPDRVMPPRPAQGADTTTAA
jgi:prophage regulatory protein